MPKKPTVLKLQTLAQTRLFRVEQMDLQFSNGVQMQYERLANTGHQGVMMVASPDPEHFLLIREYAAGFDEYQLTLPKGAVDAGETLAQAANRELQEEVGFAAKDIVFLQNLSIAPGHMGFSINIMLAQQLTPQTLAGDEPEPLEVVTWAWQDLPQLLARADFTEARAIAALYMARDYLQHQTDGIELPWLPTC